MVQQLFADQITVLNKETTDLEQKLAENKKAIERFEKLQNQASQIFKQLSEFTNELDETTKSQFKEAVLELFENNSAEQPKAASRSDSRPVTKTENNSKLKEQEKPLTEVQKKNVSQDNDSIIVTSTAPEDVTQNNSNVRVTTIKETQTPSLTQTASAAVQVKPENLEPGDIVETQRGEFEVIKVEEATNRPGFLAVCKCLKHNSSLDLVGDTVEIPLADLSIKQKNRKQDFCKPVFQVGQEVEIISSRKGEKFVGKTGKIYFSNNLGLSISIDGESEYFKHNEVRSVFTKDNLVAATAA